MCGWTAFWTQRASTAAALRAEVEHMAEALRHRGPDDAAAWVDEREGLALGFRRLAIVDLTEDGRQPMRSASGRFVIVFNGEVYNHRALRTELAGLGHRFRGHSDTEVMLAAIEQWSLTEALRRFIGMFAFALWDRDARRLSLVRDRLGIKPLYYGWTRAGTLLCGSELKALVRSSTFQGEVDRGALCLYLRHNYVPAPYCIYRGFSQLLPGSVLTFGAPGERATPACYWSAIEIAARGAREQFRGGDEDAVDRLEELLRDAVALRMIADVPLGAFLSGGIDSSAVVALMQAQSSRPVRTFSIGFSEPQFDESSHARAVARHLGTEHTELRVGGADAMAVIPGLAETYDEPFADSSQIPTLLLSALTRRSVTVSLSGDGGDELFAGYDRYVAAMKTWRSVARVPNPARKVVGRALGAVPLAMSSRSHVMRTFAGSRFGEKLGRIAALLSAAQPDDIYHRLVSHCLAPHAWVVDGLVPPTVHTDRRAGDDVPDFLDRMMLLDTLTYLPDDILTKVDRASMAVALEARVPLIDHRVVEFAWTIPRTMKLRDGRGKWLLRQVLHRHVPSALVDRPKMGFGVPLGDWLRGPLRGWAEELLDEQKLRQQGYLRWEPIRQLWKEHQDHRRDWQYHLWDVLMFQAWVERWRPSDC